MGDLFFRHKANSTPHWSFSKTISTRRRELYQANPNNESLKNGLAISYETWGDLSGARQFRHRLGLLSKDLKLMEELHRDNPKSEELKNGLAISYGKLGELFQAQGKFDTALVFFKKRSQLSEELYQANPKNESLKNGLAISYSKLGDLFSGARQIRHRTGLLSTTLSAWRTLPRQPKKCAVVVWFGGVVL
ncbi:MAG: hypothetical protein IPJ74_26660 [Saprospiraceae bacterium]|nr:hypothetical protein [Saprospiraceae bacterium]